MALKFEELRVLQAAEAVGDGIWRQVVRWDSFAREVVGRAQPRAIGEATAEYVTGSPADAPTLLFSQKDLEWLQTIPDT